MLRFVAIRLASAVPVLFGVVLALFLMIQFAPGDPVQAIVGDIPVTPEFREQVTAQYHLDDPVWRRFIAYIGNLVQGDLGYSTAGRQSVADLIWSRLPATALLVGTSLVLAAVLGTTLGMLAGSAKDRWPDHAINTWVLVAFATPGFWLGQLLVAVFALRLGWFPTGGMRTIGSQATGWDAVVDVLHHLVLPVVALCSLELASITRVSRASSIEVLNQDHITTSRLKGLGSWATLRHHVLRNSLLPVVTVVGFRAGTALAGTVLIESVFSWPGMGLLLTDAIVDRDNQVIVGIVLMLAVMAVAMNIITDVVYGILDPRIRTGGHR
jgi:peptide/nickel transport system permease protein